MLCVLVMKEDLPDRLLYENSHTIKAYSVINFNDVVRVSDAKYIVL